MAASKSSLRLHDKAMHLNWDDHKTLQKLRSIVDNPRCDRATALYIYWSADPSHYQRYGPGCIMTSPDARETLDLIKLIENKILANEITLAEIDLDPTDFDLDLARMPNPFCAENEAWEIPDCMYDPTGPSYRDLSTHTRWRGHEESFRSIRRHQGVIELAPKLVQEIGQLLETFDETEVDYVDCSSWGGRQELAAIAILHGRYMIRILMAIKADRDGTDFSVETPPRFTLVEFTEMIEWGKDPDGYPAYRYDLCRELSPADWGNLISSGGDISTLGISVLKDSPVENLRDNWRKIPIAAGDYSPTE